jgi:hypothetical protein
MSDLFIIGAGASKPYGFPTGEELFGKITELDFSSEEKRKIAYKEYYNKDCTASEDDIKILNFMKGLASELKNSMMVSIDDFIRTRTYGNDKMDIQANLVKRIIAKIIFNCERNSKNKYNMDWLHYLCSFVDRIRDRDKIKFYFLNSKFITFNYDRLLEYSVYKYFDCDKGVEETEIAEILKNMNIIHPNSYLGPLYFACFGDNNIRDNSINEIKTVWDKKTKEDIEKDKYIEEYISFSERIFFLGFGYLEENMKKLGLDTNTNILAGKKIYGTAYKKTDAEFNHILAMLRNCGAETENIEINKERTAKDLIIDFFNA